MRNDDKWTKAKCDICGEDYELRISVYRKSIKHFCGKACYDLYRGSQAFLDERDGQRMARAVLEAKNRYPVQCKQVVHFIDDNPKNVDPGNLEIFSTAQAHIDYHQKMETGEK